ncbi:hypothetical protein V8O11_04180 [Erwinia aphidicola]|uniref:hypothetical protein n=1 Tax=Erwinia aphidicola TaxID=68334 RepID=UPI00300DB9CE
MNRQFSLRLSINLVVSEPFINFDEFCRRTGYKPSYARQMIRENRLAIQWVSELTDELMAKIRNHEYTRTMDVTC